MVQRKIEKTAALAIVAVSAAMLFVRCSWDEVGIYAGCGIEGRMIYPLFHVNPVHFALNAWCLLSIVFYYDTSWIRMLLAYAISASVPADTIFALFGRMGTPTVGLSGFVFALFGMTSFDVIRKLYYQAWMCFYLIAGFILPNSNGWIHLYCYAVGFAIALLNKPIRIVR